jgi:hypothetical protein
LRDSVGFAPNFPPYVRWLLPIKTDINLNLSTVGVERQFKAQFQSIKSEFSDGFAQASYHQKNSEHSFFKIQNLPSALAGGFAPFSRRDTSLLLICWNP